MDMVLLHSRVAQSLAALAVTTVKFVEAACQASVKSVDSVEELPHVLLGYPFSEPSNS